MAAVPRYLGTTAGEAAAYVRDTIGSGLFLQVFDLDGDGDVETGSEDERAFVRAVCSAEGEVDEALRASSGAPFVAPIPDSIREIAAMRSLWCAVRWRVWADADKAPFRVLYKDTDARLARIRTDNGGRIPSLGTPQQTAALLAKDDAPASFFGDPNAGFGGFGGF